MLLAFSGESGWEHTGKTKLTPRLLSLLTVLEVCFCSLALEFRSALTQSQRLK